MKMEDRQELLEIYKLQSNLADSVSRQRGTTNRFYLVLMSGLSVLLSTLSQWKKPPPLAESMVSFGLLGMLLAAAWYIHIRSYRQLNSGKFKALHELEEKLAYNFFKREWELLGEGGKLGKYWKLTVVETFIPIFFFVAFAVLFILGICKILGKCS